MQSKFLIVCLAVMTCGSGCGLKGPLYRPGEQSESAEKALSESEKLRRPRPAPQVQKEDRTDAPTNPGATVTPVDPEAPSDSSSAAPVESMPADETR